MLQNVWKVCESGPLRVFFRRNVQPEAADAVAVVLQRLLAPLAQGNEQTLQEAFSKPNDAAVWLKTIATTLEALTVHLPYSSQQMSGSARKISGVDRCVDVQMSKTSRSEACTWIGQISLSQTLDVRSQACL